MTGLLARGVATDPIERLKSELLAVGIDPASRSETLSAGHRRIIGFWFANHDADRLLLAITRFVAQDQKSRTR